MTGSQKVGGSNPPSSTFEATTANTTSNYLSISPNSYTQLAIPLHRLIEGFLLSCKVENKSPATISFYKNILDKFQWYLHKYVIDIIDATTIRSFLGYLKDSPSRWDSNNTRAHRPVDVDHVWLGRDNAPFTIDGIAQMIRNLGKKHGIRLSPHKLRHSFAISFLRNGANPFELQIALGHTTLEMTRRYTQALGFDDVFKRHVMASPVDRLIR